MEEVNPRIGRASSQLLHGASPNGSSSSGKTQVTSRQDSLEESELRLLNDSSTDHSPTRKSSPSLPASPTPLVETPANLSNGFLGTFSGNQGQITAQKFPAQHSSSSIETSQTDQAQLARIWSAGDEQWAGGGQRGGRGQGPPWAWSKGRRRRRKLPGVEAMASSSSHLSASTAPSLSGHVPHSVGAATFSLQSKESKGSTKGGVKSPVQSTEEVYSQAGGGAGSRYEVLRSGGGRIDFEVMETGEFDGFRVTRTKEVDAPPLALPQEAKSPNESLKKYQGDGRTMSSRHKVPEDSEVSASKRQRLLGAIRRPPETILSSPLHSREVTLLLPPSTFFSPPVTLYQKAETTSSSAPPPVPLPTTEDTYSRELSQMKQEVKQGAKTHIPHVETTWGDDQGPMDTTLSSLFSGELIPPLPDHWGRPWEGEDGWEGDISGDKMTTSPPRKMTADVAVIPLHLSTLVPGDESTGGDGSAWKTKQRDTILPYSKAATPHVHEESDIDETWNQQQYLEQNMNIASGRAGVPVASRSHDSHHDTEEGGMMKTGKAEATDSTTGGEKGGGASWPGAGERVEFVTVVPGGSWDVWGGPALWDSISSSSNHSLRGSPVYSVYWGDTGGPGSPAGWPEGVWVIRGGSLAAIMALVATISVQVSRDGQVRRPSAPADGPQRALHSQHATLATNLATSLASAHVLLIFGIEATGRAWVCGVVGLLLHFLHLVSCFWLLALTTRLLSSLRQRPTLNTALYCVLAWGASLGLVVISYVVNPEGYETRRYCWMSVERGMLVSFIVPVCSLILLNAGLCLAAQKLLLDMREGVKHDVMAGHKRNLRGAVCLLPLEGVSWFLCVVALEDHQSLALDCAAALVSASLGWLVLYFHGWSWRCHGQCWLRQRLYSSSSATSSISSRRLDDLSLPLTARYDPDLAHQPLLHPLPPPPPPPSTAQGSTVTVTPTTSTCITPPPPSRPEEFPLQTIFPGHDRREVY
ncbi:uncharacterized protein LOC127007598 [Eriocheir sinensis]|uniref:uncharacterized protein LOC127007598 n=1 Tax=Eriocheir sinensis TaxID=95602 RepID=UPI0021C71814|nr:uncharacterized protein LOC127007598 [Eriocheir sinensis]